MMVAESFRSFNVFVEFCQRTTKTSSRPTAKHSSPFSPLVLLTFERLRLILRRKRADPFLLLQWNCCTLLPFVSLLLAIVRAPAVSPELVAQLPLLGLRGSVLSRSTHSCHQGSDVFPPFFNSFSTFRADHGTSMSFARQHHTTSIPLPRLRYH